MGVQNVVSAKSAGPGRPAARTDSDDFFFLERATFTPTWMRPLFHSANCLCKKKVALVLRLEILRFGLYCTEQFNHFKIGPLLKSSNPWIKRI